MTTTYSKIEPSDAEDFMPTDCANADSDEQTILGVLQQHSDEVDLDAAKRMAIKYFGPNAVLRGEGEDIEDGVMWLVIEKAATKGK